MLNKLNNFFHSILFFYILFFISITIIVITLSHLPEAKDIKEERYITVIGTIGVLILITSLSVIFAPPIIKLKDTISAFILRKNTDTDIITSEISPHRIPHHFTFIENFVIFATIIGIFFIGIIIYVLFYLFFNKVVFLD